MSRYAVIDIETTGLSLAYNHRAVEVAVVLVDDEGSLVYEWETVLNPQRDIGAAEIHGLTAADIYSAPTFDQIAPELASLLTGRVPVAHNLSFDVPFVAAEFARAGYPLQLDGTCGLCTMRLATRYLRAGPRSLEACCDCIGFQPRCVHAALEDARGSAHLLSHYIRSDRDFLRCWVDVIAAAQDIEWPAIPSTGVQPVSRRSLAEAPQVHFLGRLASRTPRSEIHPEANSYLALLDRVLLDRRISLHEQDELVSAAQMMGLSREGALAIHRLYLNALGRLALDDGVITSDEHRDLMSVAQSLGLSAQDVEASLDSSARQSEAMPAVQSFALRPGDRVVFTGDAPGIDRADLEYQARGLGLRVTTSVSGKTALVAAGDPDSVSGKARKARELGVPIVDYGTYLSMLDSVSD